MFDLEYFWYEYKKIVILLFIFIIISIISAFYYNNSLNKSKELNIIENKNIKINVTKDKANLNVENLDIVNNKKIYKYQVYIYPSKFNLTCDSLNNKACNKIINKKDELYNSLLWISWWTIKNTKNFEFDIKNFLYKKFNKKNYLKNFVNNINYSSSNLLKNEKYNNTWYEKYFEFKKIKNKKVTLNNLEVQCASDIIMSVVPWSFEADKIIKEKIKENCSILWSENSAWILELNNNKKKKSSIINLRLEISELKLKYIFSEKDNNKNSYNTIDTKNINIWIDNFVIKTTL